MVRALRTILTFILGVAVFIGLPLVGWGVAHISGFLSSLPRFDYVVVVVLLNAYAAIRIPEIGKKRPKSMKTVRRQHRAVIAMQVISLAIAFVAPFCDRRSIAAMGVGNGIRCCGLVLYAVGFLLMHWSEAALGKQFSVEVAIQEQHKLITSGPYRFLRHPRYLGIILFSCGLALVFGSWIALTLSAVMVFVLLWRIGDEEALMREEFGAEWEIYSQRTRRLIPFGY